MSEADLQEQIQVLRLRVSALEDEVYISRVVESLDREMFVEIIGIAKLVAQATGIPLKDIRSDRRDAPTAKARHILVYLACRHTKLTTPKIGMFLKRDHTSIMHGRDRIKDLMEVNHEVRDLIERISSELTPRELSHPEVSSEDNHGLSSQPLSIHP